MFHIVTKLNALSKGNVVNLSRFHIITEMNTFKRGVELKAVALHDPCVVGSVLWKRRYKPRSYVRAAVTRKRKITAIT